MEQFAALAREVVVRAGAELREAWGRAKRVEYKGDIDLVTETDREIEALVAGELRAAFPGHRIVAEEASGHGAVRPPEPEEHVWYLDPLDGTTNFAHSYPQFAVSLALARGAELLVGVVYDPLRDELFEAAAGKGATLGGAAIHVSEVPDLGRALLATGFPYDRRAHADFYLGFVKELMLRAHGIRRAGSAALDLCSVACGRVDGFWEWKLKPWDTAAGVLIVREAGGTVTDFAGGGFDLFGEQTLATNGRLHAEMIDVLGRRAAVP
jgi:myo-inositol-1(or 4)-monophosphatase